MDPENYSLNALILFLVFPFCASRDTITPTQPFTDGHILVSEGENFALGFFCPGSSRDRYIGIWYNKVSEQTVVWVANRESPIKDSSGVLMINGDGNLVVASRNQSNLLWSTNITVATRDSIAKLSNSGNFVLIQNNSRRVLWQSFDYPTHMLLPGMKMGLNQKTGLKWFLTSWKSPNDPARGNFSYALDPRGSPQVFVYRGSTPYWRSGPWNGYRWSGVPVMTHSFIFNYSYVNDEDGVYMTYTLYNDSIFSTMVLDDSGSVQRLTWIDRIHRWNMFWSVPGDQCDNYGLCGPYGSCTSGTVLECSCLPGFKPKSPRDWNLKDGSAGCVRKRESSCGKGEGFVKLERLKLPDTSMSRVDRSLSLLECQKQCLSNCSCTAYSSADLNGGGSGCMAWYGELMDIRDYPDDGQDLYIRVDAIELGFIAPLPIYYIGSSIHVTILINFIVLAANARRNSKGFLGQKRNVVILIVSIVAGLFLLVSCGCFLSKKKRKETKVAMERRHKRLFGDSPATKELDQIRSNPELPFFDLSILVAATENFSSTNMLGKGGFGPVYKVILQISKAWDLWNEGRALDIVDSSMVDSCPAHEASRCIHVGLLCVQQSAENRPTMPTIVFMLDNETTMPPPKQPAYVTRTRNAADLYAIQSGNCSINEVTMTTTEAR
ncbi:hypothetical protein HHK36_005501 [Tetracentron sinense]|uniref:Receptor-like serine/threonine-protein kinase n=1 Tax=Tetracentron sinense TaxID=13715 RepID=A0A834ZPI8_TETSI|nr:hypothetical protein HHK36_005501 [Tetracentron sinense]